MATTTSPASPTAMPKRIFNFSAGPATLPESVLLQAREDILSIFGSGIGIMEHSHRGKEFIRVIEEAEADCRTLANISDDYAVLFLQGGATTQFATIPMNFLPSGKTADYLNTGVWTTKAIKEAKNLGSVNVAFEGKDCDFDHVPTQEELSLTDGAAYLHYCSNNTIFGTQYKTLPSSDAPLIADMSSDIFSRPLDINAHAMIYAGAQKNLGPAGTALIIIRKDFMETGAAGLPSMFDYRQHAAKGSSLNTPPTFGIYVIGQVFKWLLNQGGIDTLNTRNIEKSALLYDAIDTSNGFYSCVSKPECRSLMNVSFKSPNADLDAKFVQEALDNDMSGLKGHRSAGGLRASIYNAFPRQGCEVLAQFMRDFTKANG
ncbi:MAG: phosphoserine transaminase [Planctomycetota bacterium]|nr:phosphoserine transaminase [Planctomycetota bacterium]